MPNPPPIDTIIILPVSVVQEHGYPFSDAAAALKFRQQASDNGVPMYWLDIGGGPLHVPPGEPSE